MDDLTVHPETLQGDPFTYAATRRIDQERLAMLEERYRHELLSDEERMELWAQIIGLRRRLRASAEGVR